MATVAIFLLALFLIGIALGIATSILRVCFVPLLIVYKIASVFFIVGWNILKRVWHVIARAWKVFMNYYCCWFDRHYSYRNNFDNIVIS
ncbi:MAG: hypothetical protein NC095_06650 [Muribaculum sp.]|nr:hypothetical protein [Muribaculum sp.]